MCFTYKLCSGLRPRVRSSRQVGSVKGCKNLFLYQSLGLGDSMN